jgi:hypothetical protein
MMPNWSRLFEMLLDALGLSCGNCGFVIKNHSFCYFKRLLGSTLARNFYRLTHKKRGFYPNNGRALDHNDCMESKYLDDRDNSGLEKKAVFYAGEN